MKKERILLGLCLFLVITLAFTLRYYQLDGSPNGLYVDEVGQGYNAYSILKTGKDEFGKTYPVLFRSFLAFNTPTYIYILVPLIKLLGLNSFSVRLPSLIFSTLTLPFLFLLTKNLVSGTKLKMSGRQLGILATLLLSISPWHIIFGRAVFEVNVSLFFLLAGLYFFYQSIEKDSQRKRSLVKPFPLAIATASFALSIISYRAMQLTVPILGLMLLARHKKQIIRKESWKTLAFVFTLGMLILLPTMSLVGTPGFLGRASGLSIFSYSNATPAGYISGLENKMLNFIVNNNLFLSVREFLSLYLTYLNPRNMFLLGDSENRMHFPQLATFYLWQFPFYLYGLYLLIKNKKAGEVRFLIITLLIISPLPAALTRDPYSTIRSLPLVIPQIIIIAFGLISFFNTSKKYKIIVLRPALLILVFVLFISYSVIKLWSSAIILHKNYRAKDWHYGWEKVVETINKLDPDLPIVVDNARQEAYIHLLFFLKYDPETYQKDNFEVPLNQYYTNLDRKREKKIGRITTRPIDWERDLLLEQYLVGDALSISDKQIKEHDLELVRDIDYPDRSRAFRIVKINSRK